MPTTVTLPIAIEELEAFLVVQPNKFPIRLPALDADIDLNQLIEIAAETDDRGPLATIRGLP